MQKNVKYIMSKPACLAGLDYLSYPTGVIHQAQNLAAAAFGGERTWFLVNGTTTGKVQSTSACKYSRRACTLAELMPWAGLFSFSLAQLLKLA